MNDESPRQDTDRPPAAMLDSSGLTWKVLREAVRKVPEVKWGIGVAGLVAVLAIILGFKIGYWILVFGIVILIVLMIMLVIFSRLAKMRSAVFAGPANLLIRFCTVLFIVVASLLATSAFFNWPIQFRDMYFLPHGSHQETNGEKSAIQPDAATGGAGNGSQLTSRPIRTSTPNPIRNVKTGGAGPHTVEQVEKKRQTGSAESNPSDTSNTECDDVEEDISIMANAAKENDAFIKSFTRQVLNRDSKKPLINLEVHCGTDGQERKSTNVDGIFSCTLPAHTAALWVEISDSRYEHFHKRLRSDCRGPILLRPIK